MIADLTARSCKENDKLLSNLQCDPPSKRKTACDDEIEETNETSRKEQTKEVRKKRKLEEKKKRGHKKKREMQNCRSLKKSGKGRKQLRKR